MCVGREAFLRGLTFRVTSQLQHAHAMGEISTRISGNYFVPPRGAK
jgi:hypothetical protein